MLSRKTFAAPLLAIAALVLAACNGGGSTTPVEGEMALGAAEGAKVTVVEYASVTCGVCAAWQKETWPAFKAKYVDTNQVRYVFRELPTPPIDIATAGFLLGRCAGPDRYFEVIHGIMDAQEEWATGVQPRASLVRIAGEVGLNEDQFAACISNPEGLAALDSRINAARSAGVTGTPTFFVNETRISSPGSAGASLADLSAAIDAELAQ